MASRIMNASSCDGMAALSKMKKDRAPVNSRHMLTLAKSLPVNSCIFAGGHIDFCATKVALVPMARTDRKRKYIVIRVFILSWLFGRKGISR